MAWAELADIDGRSVGRREAPVGGIALAGPPRRGGVGPGVRVRPEAGAVRHGPWPRLSLRPRRQTPGPEYRIQSATSCTSASTYQPDQNEQLPVRPDGRISLATTGEIEAVGLTPGELAQSSSERSSSRLRNPEVMVVVTKVAEQRVYVGGEVARPGYRRAPARDDPAPGRHADGRIPSDGEARQRPPDHAGARRAVLGFAYEHGAGPGGRRAGAGAAAARTTSSTCRRRWIGNMNDGRRSVRAGPHPGAAARRRRLFA